MSFCDHCFVAVPHEGTPAGKIEQIGGIETYVAIPDKDYPKDKAVVILTDIFGLGLVNNKLLGDGFVQNGFQTYIPDLFDDDPITEAMRAIPGFNHRTDWLPRHSFSSIKPKIDVWLTNLREQGITSLAFVGYCFGARLVIDYALARHAGLTAIAITHPSFINVPEDWEKLIKLEDAGVPLLINSCETDPRYDKEAQEVGDKLLGDGKYLPGYKRTYWPGCTHGFAVRGDLSKPEIKAGKEGAFKATVEWFIQNL